MTTKTGPVLLGGIATQAVAALCWYAGWRLFGSDLLKLWFNLIIPFGALALGFLGASGFWFAGRAMKLPSTQSLGLIAAGIAVVAVFAIRFLGYWMLSFDGVRVHEVIGFGTYLGETLGHTRMDFSHNSHALGSVEIGAFGYLMEALQIAAYAISSYGFAMKLPRAARCEACDQWMEEKQSDTLTCSDPSRFAAFYEGLPESGAERLASMRAAASDNGPDAAGKVRLTWRTVECGGCGSGALIESGQLHDGNYFASLPGLTRSTPLDRRRASAPQAQDAGVTAPPRGFGRRTVP